MDLDLEERIRDPVHGYIRLSDAEVSIIDLPAFQRLRRIRQLALTSYVYPGATHTRFEHTLGVVELVTRMFQSLKKNTPEGLWRGGVVDRLGQVDLDEVRALTVLRLSALMHDLGHTPFSHACSVLLEGEHEDASVEIAHLLRDTVDNKTFRGATELATKLIDRNGMNCPVELSFLRQLLAGQVDADRCDYLLRDSLHCGVQYGRFDLERLVDCLMVVETDDGSIRLAVERGGVHAVEALILARYYMNSQVYCHRIRRLFDHYLSAFCISALTKVPESNPLGLLEWDDVTLLNEVRRHACGAVESPGRYAKEIWFRSTEEKHSAIYESSDFTSWADAKKLGQRTDEFMRRHPDNDIFMDQATRDIHDFAASESVDEPKDQFVVASTKRGKVGWSLVSAESRIMEKLRGPFQVLRVYASGSPEQIRDLEREFNDGQREEV